MHRLLVRQIRRVLGIANAEDLLTRCALPGGTEADEAARASILSQLPVMLEHVSGAYEQYERDIALLRNSLEISSHELMAVNRRFRAESAAKTRTLEALQDAISRLYGESCNEAHYDNNIYWLAEKIICLTEERESMQRALAEERDRAQVTLASIGDGVLVADSHGHVTYLNDEAERITGWELDEAQGVNAAEVAMLLDEASGQPLALHPVMHCRLEKAVVNSNQHAILLAPANQRIPVEHTASPIFRENGDLSGVVMILRNVSKSREIVREMSWQATHDALTGLWSRAAFENKLHALIRDARENDGVHALLYLDLDQFKVVNDTCGHAAGDELLKQLAFLLQKEMRHNDVLARLGGDEFGILLSGCPFIKAREIGDRLLDTVRDFRFVSGARVFEVGASIGLVGIDANSGSASDTLSHADMACYAAKDMGRNRIHVYKSNDEHLAKRQEDMHWASRINMALAENRFRLHAQEIRSLGAEETPHLEILLRMIDESGKEIPPGAFLPAAERYNLMGKIDRWVVSETLQAMVDSGFRNGEVRFAINISALSLMDEELAVYLREQLSALGIAPAALCLEITETAVIAHLATALTFIHDLKALGCAFALDDFGAGMSSFAYLKNLPVDYLKIDGTFVRDIVTDPIDRTFVETINRIGQVMGKKTIAEFAEDENIIRMLAEMGVDYAQGYGVSRPMPLEDWLSRLAEDKPEAA